MTFSHPWVLLLLIAPAAWAWFRATSHGHAVVAPFDHAPGKRRRFLTTLLATAHSLPYVLVALAIVLLAGPISPKKPEDKRVVTNINFLLDVSGSMTAPFDEGTRYDAAINSLLGFVDVRKGDAFALTIFGSNVLHWCPLTNDPSALHCAKPFLDPQKLPPVFGGTMIGLGLDACIRSLSQQPDGDRMVILITDGYSADLSGGNDVAVAKRLKDNKITVFAIHVAQGAPPAEIGVITSITGGEVFAAGDTKSLQEVFKAIDAMAKAKVEKQAAEAADNFQPWSLAGLGVLGAWVLCLFGFRYTPW